MPDLSRILDADKHTKALLNAADHISCDADFGPAYPLNHHAHAAK